MEKELLSPVYDFVFKRIFGNVYDVDIVRGFLQSVLDLPADEYEKLTILDPHLRQESREDKLGILDVMLETASGSAVNIEIQVERSPNLRERLAYYKSKMITRQLKSARDYGQISRVICILISKYTVLPEEEYYHNKYCMINDRTGRRLSDLEEINILELSKVPKESDELLAP